MRIFVIILYAFNENVYLDENKYIWMDKQNKTKKGTVRHMSVNVR